MINGIFCADDCFVWVWANIIGGPLLWRVISVVDIITVGIAIVVQHNVAVTG